MSKIVNASMVFTSEDVAHIAAFNEGAFRDWRDIVAEVHDNRRETATHELKRAGKALRLTFN